MPDNTQKEFKRFEKLFNLIYKEKAEKRRTAKGTLTPQKMRKHLASGAPLEMLYGVNAKGKPFTVEDLKRFDKATKRAKKRFGFNQSGVPINQLIASSHADDIHRAKRIRSATLYRFINSKDGVILRFRVTAGPKSKYQHHQVQIRLEEWTDWITSTAPFEKIARMILDGRVSFECDCGRHQYWYRYLATVGGFAIKPLEYSYPKIRNPKLVGCCCKHVLKVFATIQGPAVRRMIINEMKKHAETIGFGGDKKGANRFLRKDEADTVERSSVRKKGLSRSAARKAFEKYRKAKKGIRKKMEEQESKDALKRLEVEKTTYKKIARMEQKAREKEKRAREQAEKDVLKFKLSTALMKAVYKDNIPKEDAMKTFADENKMSIKDVEKLAEGISL